MEYCTIVLTGYSAVVLLSLGVLAGLVVAGWITSGFNLYHQWKTRQALEELNQAMRRHNL